MKSRFFYGVFVGFIVASLFFFFFFFGVARAQTATPERRAAVYHNYLEGGADVSRDGYSVATYNYAGSYDGTYTSYLDSRDEYQYSLAQYQDYAEYNGVTAADYEQVAYNNYAVAYRDYSSGVYQQGIA